MTANASVKQSVRVLSWWGYIDPKSPETIEVEKKCNTRISVDEFYSNAEFLDRISGQDKNPTYDILIFSDTIIKSSQTKFIESLKTKINRSSKEYNSDVNNFYQNRNYNPSTAVFQISLTGFLVNKEKVSISSKSKLKEFFSKSPDNIFVLLDDHVEIATLLKKWECDESSNGCSRNSNRIFPSEEKLKNLIGKSKLVISSDLADITKHPKFAVAYTWSGDALQKLAAQKNLEFMLHPSLSHTSMDLLTLASQSPEASCVANYFSSKAYLNSVSIRTKYFSPFGAVPTEDKNFENLQREFFARFSSLGRIHRITKEESLEIDKKWQLFKILFGSKL
jgi:spermidine/putrescine-binding protein